MHRRQAGKNGCRIARGGCGDFLDGNAAQAGQRQGNARQLIRRVAGADFPLRRNVRRIGFEHDGVERQGRGQFADAAGAGKGHGTAEAELEAELDELVGLLPAAVEGMGDAARHLAQPQVFQHRIDRAPHVEQDRKIVVAGNLQLGAEIEFLLCVIARLDKLIETDFAHRQGMLAQHRFAQGIEVGFARPLHIHGVDAVGRTAAGMFATDRGHGAEVGALHRRHHDQADTRLQRGGGDRITIGIEFRGIQVAVGIYQHDRPRSLDLVDPGLLYRFQLLFATVAFAFLETGQGHDPGHQIDKIDPRRIDVRVGFGKLNRNFEESVHFISSSALP